MCVPVWAGSEPLGTTAVPTITNIHIEFPASKVCRLGGAPEPSPGLLRWARLEPSLLEARVIPSGLHHGRGGITDTEPLWEDCLMGV